MMLATSGNMHPVHTKLVGNQNRIKNSNIGVCADELHAYLTQIEELYAEPYATRFIRERTSLGIREAEKDKVELPLNISKRKIYENFCLERGFLMKSDAKGK